MAKTDFSKLTTTLQKNADRKKSFENGGTKKFEKVEWGKIPFGDSTLMVLPPKSEDVDFFHEVYVHHNYPDPVNPDKKRSYKCSKKEHGSCPICDHVEKLKANGDTKRAGELRAQRTFLYNCMDQEGNVKVYPMKPSQHTEVCQEVHTSYIDSDLDITNPANGKMIKISRLKASPWARARVIGKSLEMSEAKVAEVLGKLKDLTKVYIDNTPEELGRVLNGEEVNFKPKASAETENEEDGSDAEETETVAAAPAPAPKVEAKKVEKAKAAPAPKAEAAPAPKVETKTEVKAEAAKESTGDAELDAMLNDLGLE